MRNTRKSTWAAGIVAAGLVGYFVTQGLAAGDGGVPANKAVAAGSKVAPVGPGTKVPLMSATFKTSKPEDLLISVTAECTILTDLVINGSPTTSTVTAEARGQVRIWVELDKKIVPIEDVSTPPQDPAESGKGTDADKVTFCDRLHRRTVTDSEQGSDGIDTQKDRQETMSANAFNWVRLNAGSGEHTVIVYADFFTNIDPKTGSHSEAYVGKRSLVIEPTKLANNAVIGTAGTSNTGQ